LATITGFLLVLALAGCGFHWSVVGPADEKEYLLISETARYAGLVGVRVTGEIVDKLSPAQADAQLKTGVTPAGWYDQGVAYYYRPQIRENMSIELEAGKETVSNVAAHEVCHAISYKHDLAHWNCMNKWATPTYSRP